jgi:hypothetical protein
MHPSFKTTSSRQNHKQTTTELLYRTVFIKLLLIHLHIVPMPIYELNIQKEWHWPPTNFLFDLMAVCEGGESGGELCGHNGGRPPTRHGRQGPQPHRQDRGLSRQSGEGLRARDPDFDQAFYLKSVIGSILCHHSKS